MAENPIQPPPPREGLTSEGFVTRVWYRWLQLMARTAIQGTDVEKIVAAEVYRAKTSVLNKRIRDLETMLELVIPPKSYDSRIDALEAYMKGLEIHHATNYGAKIAELKILIASGALERPALQQVADITLVSVVDIDSPTEVGSYKGAKTGSILIAYEVEAASDQHIIYAWDEADAGGVNAPYVMAGSSGFWAAIGGKYIANNSRFNALTASLIVVSDANKGLDSLAKQAHIADASTAHAVADFAGTNAALDALGAKINAILSVLETALILNTA